MEPAEFWEQNQIFLFAGFPYIWLQTWFSRTLFWLLSFLLLPGRELCVLRPITSRRYWAIGTKFCRHAQGWMWLYITLFGFIRSRGFGVGGPQNGRILNAIPGRISKYLNFLMNFTLLSGNGSTRARNFILPWQGWETCVVDPRCRILLWRHRSEREAINPKFYFIEFLALEKSY